VRCGNAPDADVHGRGGAGRRVDLVEQGATREDPRPATSVGPRPTG
jgi:hypothetical protein